MKNSTKRKWKKGLSVRAAALTFFVTILLVYSVGVYLFSDFIFLSANRDAVTLSADYLLPEEALLQTLTRMTHTEEPGHPGTASAEEKYGYTALPSAFSQSADAAVSTLEEAGIPYEIRYAYSIKPTDTLLWFTYAGVSDAEGYYINPAVPVILTLSGNKLKMPEDTGKNRVYLTFDDGPTAYTDDILDTLGRYGIPATFFTLGTSVEKYPETARRISTEGHLLASHGTTHKYESIYANASALLRDVQNWQKIVTDIGALPESEHYYFRFPGGSVSSYFGASLRRQMIDGLHGMGYRIYDWNILTNDGILYMRPEEMSSRDYWKETFIDTWNACASDTRIILLHDSVPETAELLPWLIRYVVSEGYIFAPLDSLETEYYMK